MGVYVGVLADVVLKGEALVEGLFMIFVWSVNLKMMWGEVVLQMIFLLMMGKTC